MKIVSWNVNGIRAVHKKGLFMEFIKAENPDIICLQETKISSKEDFPEELNGIGYENYHTISTVKKGYSGSSIMSKIKPKAVREGFGIQRYDCEGRVLEAEFDDFVLYSVYFPNGKASDERLNFKMDFYRDFENFLEEKRKKGVKIIVCGDVNTAHTEIDLARPKENENISGFLKIERDWISGFLERGYIDTFRVFNKLPENYTWWAMRARGARERNIGWRIDYFLISENLSGNLKDAFIFPDYKGSDHCPIGILISR